MVGWDLGGSEMIVSYQEVLDMGPDAWERFCEIKGVNVWAVAEGGGHCTKSISVSELNEMLGRKQEVTTY